MNDNLNQNGMGMNNQQPQPMQPQPMQQPQMMNQGYGQPVQNQMMQGYGQPMAPAPKKGNSFTIIIILLLLVIAGIGLYAVVGKDLLGKDEEKTKTEEKKDKDKETPPTTNPDKPEVATGKQYKLNGYIFTFPESYEVEENAKSNCLDVLNRNSKYFVAFYVDPYSYEEYLASGVTAIENDIIAGSKGTKLSSKEETISGRKWYIVETVDPDGLYWTEAFTKLDAYHTIVLFTQSPNQNYNAMYSDLTSIADKVKSEYDTFAQPDAENKTHVQIDHERTVSFE